MKNQNYNINLEENSPVESEPSENLNEYPIYAKRATQNVSTAKSISRKTRRILLRVIIILIVIVTILTFIVLRLIKTSENANGTAMSMSSSTTVLAVASPTQYSEMTADQTSQPTYNTTQESIAKPIERVDYNLTGVNTTKSYTVSLLENEIIVGQCWGFAYGSITQDGIDGSSSAFLITGPGQFSFSVTDGEFLKFKNVFTRAQAESLLQEKVDYLVNVLHRSTGSVKVFRIP